MNSRLWIVISCVLVIFGAIASVAMAANGGEIHNQPSAEATTPDGLVTANGIGLAAESALAELSLDTMSRSAAVMVSDWIDHGVNILAATTDASDPSMITIKVPSEDIHGPEGMATYDQIERRAAIQCQAGLGITWVNVVAVESDGQEGFYTGFLVSDLVSTSDWTASPTSPEDTATLAFESIAATAAADAKALSIQSATLAVVEGERVGHVRATVPLGGAESQGQFVDQVHVGVAKLNRQEGAAIALLTIDVVDSDGELLVREFDDFTLADGGVRAGWVTPELRKSLFQPGFME
jgi:hypothetical protein